MNDAELAKWLSTCLSSGHAVILAHADDYYMFYSEEFSFFAEIGKHSQKALCKLAKVKLLKMLPLSKDEIETDTLPSALGKAIDASAEKFTDWYKKRNERGDSLSMKDTALIWHQAAGRCMYRGCGKDLGEISLTTKAGRIGYLAHIIAAAPPGPRGCSESHALSKKVENYMLLCDEHHRLIDITDVDGHPVNMLREMRSEHISKIKDLLGSLIFPRVKAITLLTNIANASTQQSERNMKEAMLAQRLAPLPDFAHILRGTRRDRRLSLHFWSELLEDYEPQFSELSRLLRQPALAGNETPDRYAVFPIMTIPMLILCGRITGEGIPIDIFQFHRDIAGGTWVWPKEAESHPDSAMFIEGNKVPPAEEALLTVELTSHLSEKRLPPELLRKHKEEGMPWVRILAKEPSISWVRHPLDLTLFEKTTRSAICSIQDDLNAKVIHVIAVSPASSIFKFGQMLQAGHHSEYRIYDQPDGSEFHRPAISITGQSVTSLDNQSHPKTIPLR